MAKTRAQIIAQLKAYIPNLDNTTHDTTVDNLIDLAAEMVSSQHNFSYLRATAPATHDVVADEHYVDESDFSFTNFKEILFLEWIKSSTGENAQIRYLPEKDFRDRFRYVEYSGNTDGKPTFYTRSGQRLFFNRQLDETVTVRAWYHKLHGALTSDATEHSFVPDMLGFNAIVSVALSEAHMFVPGLVLNKKAQAAASFAQYWVDKLIAADLDRADEGIEITPKHMKDSSGGLTDPYYWIS